MVKKIFLLIFLALSAHPSLPAFASGPASLIISDVDDTVKLSNVPNTGDSVLRVFGEEVFPGMKTLYSVMAWERDSLVFLSGGPTFLEHHVREVLDENGFSGYQLLLRDIFVSGGAWSHKTARLRELSAASPARPFILIGDDGEKDPEIFSAFSAAQPGKVHAIYIHRVRGRKISAGEIGYHTAFEIALSEVKAGRMTTVEAAEVGRTVLSADPELVFPEFAECPSEIIYPMSPEIRRSVVLLDLIANNRSRWASYCAERG